MDVAWMAFSQACQVTVLVALVLVTTRLFARNRPHLAYVLWLVVLIKCVTPPLWSSPSGAFTWLQTAMAAADTTAVDTSVVVSHPKLGIEMDVEKQPMQGTHDVLISVQPYEFQQVDRFTFESGESKQANWPAVLLVIWGVGFGVALLVAGVRTFWCIRMLRRTPSVDSPELQALLAQLVRKLKVRRRVCLLITTSRIGPAVIGLLRPLIVVPEVVVRGKAPEELEAILAHELIHVRRGDLWLGLLQVCSRAVWWFYPLVWWVNRLSTRESERCCDEEVVGELGCDPRHYARSLLEILELKKTLQTVPAFPGMKPVEVTSQRLERIMKLGQGCHKRAPRWCWIVMLVTAAAALPGAAFISADEDATVQDFLAAPAGGVSDALDAFDREWRSVKSGDATVPLPDGGTVLLGGVKRQESQDMLSVAAYLSDTVIDKLKSELRCDDSQAMQTFGNMLVRQAGLTNAPVQLKDRMRIKDGAIHIAAVADEHQRLREAVEWMKKYPVAQLKMNVKFVSVPEQLVDSLISDWELTPTDLGSEALGRQPHFDSDPIDRPLPTNGTKPLAKSGVTTATNLPALFKVVDASAAAKLLADMQKDSRTNIISAPHITLFNGQSATVQDSSQRPFVVGLKTTGDNPKAFEPQIRVVECGNSLRIRPLLRNNGDLWLDYDVKVSHVESVSEKTVQVARLREPVTLQVPKVFTARIESAVEFAAGKTVLLGGLPAGGGKAKKNQLLVMMSAVRSDRIGGNAIQIEEWQTGKLMFGEGVNSDAGLLGQVIMNSSNFDSNADHTVIPLLGPITTGSRATPLELPSDGEVLEAVDHALSGDATWPKAIDRISVRLVKEKLEETVSPPRFVPTIGPAQLHQTKYKCTIYCRVYEKIDQPSPHQVEKEVTRVVYLAQSGFHLVSDDDSEPTAGQGGDDNVYAAVYNVADLIVEDLAMITPVDFASKHRNNMQRNLELLESIIPNRVLPATWKKTGGKGGIESFATNLSLVVSQTKNGHRQVAKFLREVRRQLELPSAESFPQPPKPHSTQTSEVISKTYNVADLVIPVPNLALSDVSNKLPNDAIAPDFDTLKDLVTSTVAPDTWQTVGGRGRVEPYDTNLSLVVTQTAEVHEQIAELLQQLRKLQDVQVTVEARFFTMPKNLFRKAGLELQTTSGSNRDFSSGALLADGSATLSDIEMFFFVKAIQECDSASLFAAPKVTMFNGQEASVSVSGKVPTTLLLQPVCSDDRRSVRLSFGADAGKQAAATNVETIEFGNSLIVDISETVDPGSLGFAVNKQDEVSLLANIPYVARLFKSTPVVEEMQTLLCLTPRLIVQEEEEELIGIDVLKSD